jgi:hypothetical protein
MFLFLIATLACEQDKPAPCGDGFGRADNGNCYPLGGDDSGVEGDADADADTDSDTDADSDSDADTDVEDGVYCLDSDGDGYGDPDDCDTFSQQPDGYIDNQGDCDDSDAAFHPGAEENCDQDPIADYNCDGSSGLGDGDGDGFSACDDCDDGDYDVNPGVQYEWCDTPGVDDNCDGVTDAALDPTTGEGLADGRSYYEDGDGDGFGNEDVEVIHCAGNEPSGYTSSSNDCDDGNAEINVDATEEGDACYDTVDNDCDDKVDLKDSPECAASGAYEYYLLISDVGTHGAEDSDSDGSPNAGNASIDGSGALTQQSTTFYVGDYAHMATGVESGDELHFGLDRDAKGMGGMIYANVYTTDAVDMSLCFRASDGSSEDCSASTSLTTSTWNVLTQEFSSVYTSALIVLKVDSATSATIYVDAVDGTDK